MSLRTLALRAAKTYMASRPPDVKIGPPDDPYMLRWIVGSWGRYPRGSKPKNWWDGLKRRLPNLYLHRFLHDDDDRALHDHPWASCSWLLENSYKEILFEAISAESIRRLQYAGEPRPTMVAVRREGTAHFRRATTAHRIVLDKIAGRLGRETPVEVTTAFFTGFAVRSWGFWCPRGFVPWATFMAKRDGKITYGQAGQGCGD